MTEINALRPWPAEARPLNRRPAEPGFVEPLSRAETPKTQAEREDGAYLDLARLKSGGLKPELLASLLTPTAGGRAAGLSQRADLEALLSSGRFGNLLSGRLTGREEEPAFNLADLNARRQKNGPLSLGRRPRGEGEPEKAAGAPAELLRPLRRLNMARAAGGDEKSTAEQPSAEQLSAEQLSAEQPSAGQSTTEQPSAEQPSAEGSKTGFSLNQLDKLVDKVALALNMDPHLIKAVIKTESNFDPQAVSKVGAKGLMQLMPGTAKELGVQDPFNPVENVWAGARYLKKMLDRHAGNIKSALASYNWGPGNFDRHGGLRLPGETQRYISSVTKHYARFKEAERA